MADELLFVVVAEPHEIAVRHTARSSKTTPDLIDVENIRRHADLVPENPSFHILWHVPHLRRMAKIRKIFVAT